MSKDTIHPLSNAVAAEILTRLELVALQPKRILALACNGLQERYPDAEMVTTADAEGSVDLIVSNLCDLHSADGHALFREWRRLLRPEGLLMFASYGPNTLSEIAGQEINLPHFIDMHNVGDALVQAGFADPVLDVEHFEIQYQNTDQILCDLNMMGITELQHPALSLTYEIVYGHAWCPEKSDDFMADAEGVAKIPLAALRARLRQ